MTHDKKEGYECLDCGWTHKMTPKELGKYKQVGCPNSYRGKRCGCKRFLLVDDADPSADTDPPDQPIVP